MKRKKQKRFINWLLAMLLVLNVFLPAGNVRAESDTPETGVLIINTEETPAPDTEEDTDIIEETEEPSEETLASDTEEDTDIIEETEEPSEEVHVSSPSESDKATGDTGNKQQGVKAGMGIEPFAAVDKILTDISAKVTQNGKDVTNALNINYQQPLSVEISFGIPVLGDYEDPDDPDGPYVSQGDTATFTLGEGFTILAPVTFNLVHKAGQTNYSVGTLTLSKNASTGKMEATVEFNGDEDVFNGNEEIGIHNVTAEFTANLKYDNSNDDGNGKTDSVKILDKSYTVAVPALDITYEKSKTAYIDEANKEIEWTVKVRAYKETTPETAVDLAGYVFSDNLDHVGEFTAGSVKVNTTSITDDSTVYDPDSNTLSYTFPPNSTTEQTIVFRTKISDADYYSTSSKDFTNTATVKKGEETVSIEGQTTYTPPTWISKSGKENQDSDENYDPKNRTITWSILIDTNGTTLDNAVVTDILKQGMTFKSAKLEKWSSDSGTYSDGIKSWSSPAPVNDKYELGDITGKYLLTIVSIVPNDAGDITGGITTYNNTATLSWDDYPGTGDGLGAVSKGVGVGYNAISKSGSVKDAKKQLIKWTIDVNTKGQTFPDLKVYDLLVYGESINLSEFTDQLGSINKDFLHPQYNQKYADGLTSTSTNPSFNLTKKTLTKDGIAVADLLIFEGLNNPGSTTIEFNSKVTNPDFFAANTSKKLWNTASLISGNRELNKASKDVDYGSQLLNKEMLKRGSAANTSSGANNKTSTITDGFDYTDKSAVFRLSVNANGLDWTALKNAKDEFLGDVTVKDALPSGWEFVKFNDGSDYYIFEGITGTATSVTANGASLDPSTVTGMSAVINGTTAEFTFKALQKPYVILIKARPTDATLKTYFSSNKSTNVTNELSLTTEKWTTGIKDSQSVQVDSTIIDKEAPVRTADALAQWTVNYNPYSLDILDASLPGITEMKIEDKLPEGMELKGGSVKVYEMILQPDGSLAPSKEFTPLGTSIEYAEAERLLTFHIPDRTKAYQLIYETIITSETAGASLTNTVTLSGSKTGGQPTSNAYTVQSSDASASLNFGGYVRINKTKADNTPLGGATFELRKVGENVPFRTATSKDDGKILMKVLPVGEYTLIETKAPTDYVVSKNIYNVEIVADLMGGPPSTWINGVKTNDLTVKNNAGGTVGNLIIKKTVEGNSDKTDESFDFTVILDAPGNYPYEKSDGTNGTVANGDHISLKHNQTITVFDLPIGTTYRIEEEDLTANGYVTPDSFFSGNITTTPTAEAHFINYQPGSLTIKKQVTLGDSKKPFDFTVTFTKDEVEDTTAYAYSGSNGAPNGSIKSGDTISLSDGQSITISGIPKDTQYQVMEASYASEGYEEPTISGNAADKISAGEDSAVVFKNSQSLLGGLIISKTVIGNGGSKTKKFTFTVTFDNDGTYDYVGKGVPNGKITSGDKIELADGQSISISGLLHGTKYTITEDDYSSEGYKTESSGHEGTISKDITAKAEFTNSRYYHGGGGGGGGGNPKPPVTPTTPTPTPPAPTESVPPAEVPQGYLKGPDGNYYAPQQLYDIFGEVPLGYMVGVDGQLVPLGLPKTGDGRPANMAINFLFGFSILLGIFAFATILRKDEEADK